MLPVPVPFAHVFARSLASPPGLPDLKADGFGVTELWKDEGFTLQQLSACFSVGNLRIDGGVRAEELLEVGFSLTQMREGGYECKEVCAIRRLHS